eukprot:1589906-Rhodomonas_salina.1
MVIPAGPIMQPTSSRNSYLPEDPKPETLCSLDPQAQFPAPSVFWTETRYPIWSLAFLYASNVRRRQKATFR